MTPEDLLVQYVYRPGVCHRCELPAMVAELTGWMPPEVAACPVCIIRMDQLRQADLHRRAMAAGEERAPTLDELRERWPSPLSPEADARLRAWTGALMRSLDPQAYGLFGTVRRPAPPDAPRSHGGDPAPSGRWRTPRQRSR